MIGMILFCVTGLQPEEKVLPQDLASLVQAERAFVRLSVERGVRESFLAFFAEAARSGELCYSYGMYSSASGEKGYYVRVWKRDSQGRWRIVFDLPRALPAGEKK